MSAAAAAATPTLWMWRARKVAALLSGLMLPVAGPVLRDEAVALHTHITSAYLFRIMSSRRIVLLEQTWHLGA